MDLLMLTLWEAGYNLPPEPIPEPTKPIVKGCCKHCGKMIGRGLHLHEKSCKGVK